MTEYFLLCVAILALIGGMVFLIVSHDNERREFRAERKEMMNRIMSRNFGEFIAMQQHGDAPEPVDNSHQEENKTSEYDKAWSI